MKNVKSIISSLLLASSIGFVACTEKMDIDVNNAPPQLAIYGSITTDIAQHAVTVMRSSNYFSNSAPEGISGAIVTVSDGDEVFILTESPSEKGVYLTDPNVFGVEGKTYTLKVVVEFDGVTDEYEATSLLPYSVRVDSVTFRQSDMSDYIVDALLYGRLPESNNNYLNIKTYKNDNIPLNDKLSNFNIIVSENVDRKGIDGAVCMDFFTGERFTNGEVSGENMVSIEQGDLITFQICSITKEYANYVLNAQKELQGSMPIFSGPPANVQTNISAKNAIGQTPVCGFFTAYSKQSWKVLFYLSS
ncbi:hypothetical protein FACS1894155_12090 [Bacteroidia bacterium]|nr:hypothetical protein FACS1894155_12090 [Bacteroidia bacterium]